MEVKLNYKRTFLIGLAFLSINAFWQLYDTIIPLMLQNTFRLGETLTGAVMAADNVLSLVLLPLFGMLSDNVNTVLGKRMPFIVGGTVLAVVFMLLLPAADRERNLVVFVMALFVTLVAMGLYRSPAVALMPDLTPKHLHSRGNAVINLTGAVGGIYTLLLISMLVGDGKTPDYMPLFLGVAALMLISVGVLAITVRENQIKKENAKAEEMEEMTSPIKTETVKLRNTNNVTNVKKSMIFILFSVFLWYMAYNAVTTAFSRYTMVVWEMEGGSFADCLMVATVAAIVSYIPIGSISARIGRKKTILAGVLLMATCYGIAIFIERYHPVINIVFGLVGVAWAAINVNSYPMVVAMGEGRNIGKFTGIYYTFSMTAQILTPILSGFLLENISYRTLFPYAFIFSLLAFITMSQVKHGDARPQKKSGILENFDLDD